MKMVKRLMVMGVALVLIVAGLVIVALTRVDALAKAAVEKGGTYAMGVNTTLDGAEVGILRGEFSMNGLRVANPGGYQGEHFLSLGKGSVAVNAGSLREAVITLPHLTLADLSLSLEKNAKGSNYQVILDNLKKLQGESSKPSSPGDTKLVIEQLTISNVVVSVDLLGLPGGATRATIPIREINLKNVGKTGTGVADTGVTIGQVAGIVVQAIMTATVENAGDLLPTDVLGDMSGRLAELGSITDFGLEVVGDVKGQVEKLGEMAGEAGKKVEQAADEIKKGVDKIGEGLGDLIPGKKK